MNLELKETSGFLSVGELRKFLDEHEKRWSEEDELYLGPFKSQMILSFPPSSGYTFSKMVEAFEHGGFFIFPTDQHGDVINE